MDRHSASGGSHGHHHHQPSSSRLRASSVGTNTSASSSPPAFLRQFEDHLGELDNDYLWYFRERAKLEEQFAQGLSSITFRAKAIDGGVNSLGVSYSKGALPSVRSAWRQVIESAEQEIEAHKAFSNSIKEDVVKPLSKLKAEQIRISSRIAEDVKKSKETYTEQLAHLSKLEKAYRKKTSDYVESSSQPSPLASPGLPRTPGGSISITAGAATTAFQAQAVDLAQTGKKQFRQFLSGLQGGGSNSAASEDQLQSGLWAGGGGVGSGGGDAARSRASIDENRERDRDRDREKTEQGNIRAAKAKREAEEADARYREGVFHLDSLRLNAERVSQSGANSAAQFIQELVITLQMALASYSSNQQATSHMISVLGKRSEEAVQTINLGLDLQMTMREIRPERQPTPVLYNNYYVGPCRDLIFGVSLLDYAFARGIGGESDQIPLIVEKCIRAVEERGLDAEGLYRISPRQSTVQNLLHKIEIDEVAFQFARTEEIYTIAAILKLYLRRLPEPVFRWPLQERLAFSKEREVHIANDFILLRTRLKRLPEIHLATFKAIVQHLSSVLIVPDNKMDGRNISIIFSSILFGETDTTDIQMLTLLQSAKDTALEDVLTHAATIFELDGRPPVSVVRKGAFHEGPSLTLTLRPEELVAQGDRSSSSLIAASAASMSASSIAALIGTSGGQGHSDFHPHITPAQALHPTGSMHRRSPSFQHGSSDPASSSASSTSPPSSAHSVGGAGVPSSVPSSTIPVTPRGLMGPPLLPSRSGSISSTSASTAPPALPPRTTSGGSSSSLAALKHISTDFNALHQQTSALPSTSATFAIVPPTPANKGRRLLGEEEQAEDIHQSSVVSSRQPTPVSPGLETLGREAEGALKAMENEGGGGRREEQRGAVVQP